MEQIRFGCDSFTIRTRQSKLFKLLVAYCEYSDAMLVYSVEFTILNRMLISMEISITYQTTHIA